MGDDDGRTSKLEQNVFDDGGAPDRPLLHGLYDEAKNLPVEGDSERREMGYLR